MAHSEESLPERIRRKGDELSASQKKVARYCVTEPQKAGTLTALRIAEELRVSESTVVRFAVRMGYHGFPDMQSAIRSASERQGGRSGADEPGKLGGQVGASLQSDLRLLRETIGSVDEERFGRAVDALDRAGVVHVCGFRTAFSLAYLAEYHIRQVRRSVRLVDGIGGTHSDDLALIEPDDALLVFTFPVYDDRSIAVIEYAAQIGAQCVVVTDSALAPLPLGENIHSLTARHESLSFFNSNVPATALLNAIVVRMVELQSARDPKFEHGLTERFQHERARG